jgi:hypothetical protein
VIAALDELEHTQLLEGPAIQVLDGSRNGHGITRRELGARSAKVGTAVVAAPLILSIVAPPASATATPTPFQCQIYTTKDCGVTGCGAVAGCCCCCQGGGSCKVCSSIAFCNAGNQNCPFGGQSPGHCSNIGSQNVSTGSAGCCGVSGATNCGCGFGPNAGCCTATLPHTACSPGATNCVPCCNNIPLNPMTATLNCCLGPTSTCS